MNNGSAAAKKSRVEMMKARGQYKYANMTKAERAGQKEPDYTKTRAAKAARRAARGKN